MTVTIIGFIFDTLITIFCLEVGIRAFNQNTRTDRKIQSVIVLLTGIFFGFCSLCLMVDVINLIKIGGQ